MFCSIWLITLLEWMANKRHMMRVQYILSLLLVCLLLSCQSLTLFPANQPFNFVRTLTGKVPLQKRFKTSNSHQTKWRYHYDSSQYPMTVHYQKKQQLNMAKKVMGILERSWKVQIEQMGFRPPIPYDSSGKGRLPIYLKQGSSTGVDAPEPVNKPGVWWDAYHSYITIDPWGDYGGKILESTVTHEFNHAIQASYDWYESAGFFETSATYIQDKVYPNDNDYLNEIVDFQRHPDWPIDRHDHYKTWYMYGASLYLFFLEQRYFKHDPIFLAKIWEGARNKKRPIPDGSDGPSPASNNPDWVDSLNQLLPAGKTYPDTVVEFARWRFYTGIHHDGKHFHDAHLQKPNGGVKIAHTLSVGGYASQGPLLLGSEYVTVKRPEGASSVHIQLQGQPGAKWLVQAVPGLKPGSDGDWIELGKGKVEFGNLSSRTLVITAYPRNPRAYDPDIQSDRRYGFRLSVNPSN